MIVKNSSHRQIGEVHVSENEIKIINHKRPDLIIDSRADIDIILSGLNIEAVDLLLNKYVLLISEIAAVYNISYFLCNRFVLKNFPKVDMRFASHTNLL